MGSHHDSFNGTHHYDSPRIASEGKIIMEGIVSLFTAVLFFLGMHIYVRCFWGHRGSLPRRRLSFASEQDPLRLRNVGLCKSAIEALPVFVYQLENHKDGLECAVCLCEFKADEKGRLLPKCHHSFHIECIDMWFQSHSTCPLCRASAQPDTPADSVVVVVEEAASGSAFETEQQVPPVSEGNASISREPESDIGLCHSCRQDEVLQSPTYSTNMLFWANEKRVSSVSNSAFFDQGTTSTPRQALDKIAIGIPRRVDSFSSPRLFCSDNQQLFSPSDRSNPPAFVSVL